MNKAEAGQLFLQLLKETGNASIAKLKLNRIVQDMKNVKASTLDAVIKRHSTKAWQRYSLRNAAKSIVKERLLKENT